MHPNGLLGLDPKQTRILLVDPHLLCRRSMRSFLERSRWEIEVVGEASSPEEARELIGLVGADVVLLGLADAPLATRSIESMAEVAGGRPILVWAQESGGDAVARAFAAGASGYVSDASSFEDILMAIRALAAGHPSVDPVLAAEGILWVVRHGSVHDPLGSLTPREREVIELLSEGLSPRAMAARLFVSRRTVEFHLAGAYRKLGVHSRIEALNEWTRRTREARLV